VYKRHYDVGCTPQCVKDGGNAVHDRQGPMCRPNGLQMRCGAVARKRRGSLAYEHTAASLGPHSPGPGG
jgi:hypothetical protein